MQHVHLSQLALANIWQKSGKQRRRTIMRMNRQTSLLSVRVQNFAFILSVFFFRLIFFNNKCIFIYFVFFPSCFRMCVVSLYDALILCEMQQHCLHKRMKNRKELMMIFCAERILYYFFYDSFYKCIFIIYLECYSLFFSHLFRLANFQLALQSDTKDMVILAYMRLIVIHSIKMAMVGWLTDWHGTYL